MIFFGYLSSVSQINKSNDTLYTLRDSTDYHHMGFLSDKIILDSKIDSDTLKLVIIFNEIDDAVKCYFYLRDKRITSFITRVRYEKKYIFVLSFRYLSRNILNNNSYEISKNKG